MLSHICLHRHTRWGISLATTQDSILLRLKLLDSIRVVIILSVSCSPDKLWSTKCSLSTFIVENNANKHHGPTVTVERATLLLQRTVNCPTQLALIVLGHLQAVQTLSIYWKEHLCNTFERWLYKFCDGVQSKSFAMWYASKIKALFLWCYVHTCALNVVAKAGCREGVHRVSFSLDI